MNPYAFNNLFKPVVLQDWRESEKHSHNVGLDYSMSRESIASSLFEQFYVEFVRNIFLDEMGEELFKGYINQDMLGAYWMDKVRRTNESVWFDDISTDDKVESSSDIAHKSLKNAVDALEVIMGSDISIWNWGKIHSLSLNHPLGSVDVSLLELTASYTPFICEGRYKPPLFIDRIEKVDGATVMSAGLKVTGGAPVSDAGLYVVADGANGFR